MDIQNALNFCNQYLMLKILSSPSDQPLKPIPSKLQTFGNTKKKTGGKRFQNPQKKSQGQPNTVTKMDEITIQQKPKTKKKRFEGGTLKKDPEQSILISNKEQTNKQDKTQGYVPIENLLSQLISKPEQKNNFDNFKSFGDSKMKANSNLNTHIYEKYSSDSFAPRAWQKTEGKEAPWIYSQAQNITRNLNPSQSEYLFESPNQNKDKLGTNFHVPASRSRSRTQLGYSQSCSNLSSTSQNRSYNADSHSKTKKKKKGQRQFYIPISTNVPKPLGPEISRCTSTNNIIAKFEKQIMEQQNSATKMQQEQNEKSLTSDTRFETKNKNTTIKQIQEYSMIQLDNRVRESLSFVSEANVPQKPIIIQMRR